MVGLSPQACPFDRPLSIYREVALRIELPVQDLEEEPSQGLDQVLESFARSVIEQDGQAAFRSWIQREFRRAPIESRQFQRGVRALFECIVDDNLEGIELLGDYLRGDDVELSRLAPYQLRERIDDKNAFRWLRSLAQCIRALDLPGLVLMFDEMDRNLSLSASRRRAMGDNLRQMIDDCGQSALPGVVWCYAVPPEFMDNVVPEYPALAQRLKGVGELGAACPMQPIIDLDRLAPGPFELFCAIGERVLSIYELAYAPNLDASMQSENIQALAKELSVLSFESGTRRHFVKALVAMIVAQHRDSQVLLTRPKIERLVTGSREVDACDTLAGEQVF